MGYEYFKFGSLIDQRIQTVEERLAQTTLVKTENFADPLDKASQNSEEGLSLITISNLEVELKALRKAKSRFNEEEYGYCVSCGYEIQRERLETVLHADKCADCANIEFIKHSCHVGKPSYV